MTPLLTPETKELQSKLAQYCRTGRLSLEKEVNQKHVGHYRRLVYNIIDDILENAFPLFHGYLEKEKWNEAVHLFFSSHNCQTFQVWKVPGEFYEFACNADLKTKFKAPFLDDLLLFEWIELDLHTMKDEEFPNFTVEENWKTGVPCINPEYRILSVQYPVHTIPPSQLSDSQKGQYFILIWRRPDTCEIEFMDISILHAAAIEKIEEGKTISEIAAELAPHFSITDPELFEKNMMPFLDTLKEKGFFLGFLQK